MSNENSTTNTPITDITPEQAKALKALKGLFGGEKKPRTQRGIWFAFVAQSDISEQMDVVRWLRKDSRYRVCTIAHDRDRYAEDDTIPEGKAVGDLKNPHYHGLVRLGSKITAQSLCKRFGGYLHFELLTDPAEYAAYMLHATFNARDKFQYSRDCLQDDVSLWEECAEAGICEMDACAVVERVSAYIGSDGAISVPDMLKQSDSIALRSLMSHSYFYATFVDKSKKKGGD